MCFTTWTLLFLEGKTHKLEGNFKRDDLTVKPQNWSWNWQFCISNVVHFVTYLKVTLHTHGWNLNDYMVRLIYQFLLLKLMSCKDEHTYWFLFLQSKICCHTQNTKKANQQRLKKKKKSFTILIYVKLLFYLK